MMKKIHNLFLVLACSLFVNQALAVTTVPIPMSEDTPARIGAAAVLASSYAPIAAINDLGGVAGIAYAFGGGFEGGFQLQGGVVSDKLFQDNAATNWIVGGDVMLRYLGEVTEIFYIGLQGQFGYDYTFGRANITQGSGITAAVGLPFGLSFGGAKYVVYVMPELEFGGKTADAPDEVFGTLVGLSGAIGTYIYVGGPKLYAEVRPGTRDISQTQSVFTLGAMLGIAFDM